jgi:predicted ABC-type ATPase
VGDPVLHVLAGPNGAGKTTFYGEILAPATHLEFVNADVIAAERWPDDTVTHGYEAGRLAAAQRDGRLAEGSSFATETVFSHPSKVDLLRRAAAAGYRITLHIVLVPVDLAAARVVNRVATGGHHVPEEKVRARYDRLWGHVADGISVAHEARVYDNTRAAKPFRLVAVWRDGQLTGEPDWPAWTPKPLRDAGRQPDRR